MSKDLWMRQFIHKNFSTLDQRGRAAALFIKLEILVYLLIVLGGSIFIIKVFF